MPKSDCDTRREGGFATLPAPTDASITLAVAKLPASDAPTKTRAPALTAIITYKLIKGSIFLSLAAVAYCLSDNDLPKEYQQFLDFFRIHPGNRFFSDLAVKVGQLTEVKMLWAAFGTCVYSLFSLVEGIGLIFRSPWAGWLAIGESAFFVPLETWELSRHFTWRLLIIAVINVAIVWYLFVNRHRLFRHHHH